MKSPHADPVAHGQIFGTATITVCMIAKDCVLRINAPGQTLSKFRYHSLSEIQAAYLVQFGRAAISPFARDAAAALKYAGQQLSAGDNNDI